MLAQAIAEGSATASNGGTATSKMVAKASKYMALCTASLSMPTADH